MPKRTDIKSILIIGSGPIVIGQACEFDYSGTQACKALREEGYQVVLVNSNPATIMTDPEMADGTYIEPITWQMVEKHHRQGAARRAAADAGRPDRAELRARPRTHGVLEKYGVEMIGATREAIDKAEDREKFKEAMTQIGLGSAALGASRTRWTRRCEVQATRRLPGGHPALASRWAAPAAASPTTARSSTTICKRGLDASPTNELLIEESLHRLEGVRDGGDARQGRTTASSSARSRTSTRWACTPATRSPSRRRRR